MTTRQLLLVGIGVYLGIFVLTAWLTRSSRLRIGAALLGGLSVAVVGVGVECLAHARGWWWYPGVTAPYGPVLIYPAVLLAWAVLSMIGARVEGRFGLRGVACFLVGVTIVGTLRDYRIAAKMPDFFRIAPGAGLVMIDACCWFFLTVLALFVARAVERRGLFARPLATRSG